MRGWRFGICESRCPWSSGGLGRETAGKEEDGAGLGRDVISMGFFKTANGEEG